MSDKTDLEIWSEVATIELDRVLQMFKLMVSVKDEAEVMRQALNTIHHRGSALRFLLVSQDDDLKKQVFPTLVDLASTGHADIGLCRSVIRSLPLHWVRQNLEAEVNKVLDASPDDDEYYRRYAELYYELDETLLGRLVGRARLHESPHIREVAEDYGN